ncbi:hypothetical protein [Kangiella sp.]|uniref:hypothetical protein n=1 Tax=Kangiella sp. TaxID=1920245 RepID=UPI0019886F46|nr:hypothetical protein [Kangiella sp.]MBD3652931.1 hypothetical protein [Kangiella sp.]
MTKHLAKTLTLALSTLLFVACKPATVAEPESAPSKPVAATKSVNIGASNYMTIPGHWNIKPSIMPKGFVSYTIKDNNLHMVISGYAAERSSFNHDKSRKDLKNVTLLYRAGAANKEQKYLTLDDNHKAGGYTHYTCRTAKKCYQVFPLSHWQSVIASDFYVGGMKYTITAGVDDLNGTHAKQILNAIKSIESK